MQLHSRPNHAATARAEAIIASAQLFRAVSGAGETCGNPTAHPS
jgi:hypothetical protein